MPNSHLIGIDLEDQVAALRNELGALKRVVARRGSSLYEDAGETISDYLSEVGQRVVPSLRGLRRQARTIERVAYDHPAVIAGVGLVVIGLVASLLISRRAPEPVQEVRQTRRRPRGRGNRSAE